MEELPLPPCTTDYLRTWYEANASELLPLWRQTMLIWREDRPFQQNNSSLRLLGFNDGRILIDLYNHFDVSNVEILWGCAVGSTEDMAIDETGSEWGCRISCNICGGKKGRFMHCYECDFDLCIRCFVATEKTEKHEHQMHPSTWYFRMSTFERSDVYEIYEVECFE